MTSGGGGMRSPTPPESIAVALHAAPTGRRLPEPLCGGSTRDAIARGTTTLAPASSIAAMMSGIPGSLSSVVLQLHDIAVELGLIGLRHRPAGQVEREHVDRHPAERQLDVRQHALQHREDEAFENRFQRVGSD